MPKGHIPKNQFSRKSIDLDREHEREWRTAPASELEVGDLVPDFGLIVAISHSDNLSEMTTNVSIKNPDGRVQTVTAETVCYFFGRKL